MKIALVQNNPVIGDFKRNCDNICKWAQKAKELGCGLVIFPELAVSGYPPQDLLERQSFLEDQQKSLAGLCVDLPDLDVMLGCFERRHGDGGKGLYNSAVVIRSGKIVFRARKQLLPSYDVFDETRYFEPGISAPLYRTGGYSFGVTVCEDIWSETVKDYDHDPVEEIFLVAQKEKNEVDGIINISASPFHRDKEAVRKEIFSSLCRKYTTTLFYCNQVGGQDSLLFDGRSLVMAEDGTLLAQADGFVEDLIVVDMEQRKGDLHGPTKISEESSIFSALVMGVRDYIHKCGFSSAVLGLSGGIDSALTAAIAVEALGAENVLAVALPSPYSSSDSLEDAKQLARNLGCQFEVIPIGELFQTFQTNLESLFEGMQDDLTEQNLQARIRGNLLMALSNKFGHLLLTTGNKSEMAVGYCTLYGDMSGGLAVISDVPKQLVYALSAYVNRNREIIPQRIITKAPSAELKPDQTDQDDLPPYEILDQILALHLEDGLSQQQIIDKGFDSSITIDILRRIRINEYKRKQAPLGLKVTTKAFGFGRRYPNVQNYQS